ncbi:MAG TPA: BrnA antitoxin family protein [Thermoanaerobaculia bacterium]|nr:BrnA antitoxin family protein [Thermoanaerobaculia bacterium]
MKPRTTSKPFPASPEEIASVIGAAPDRIRDPESPYDPNDPTAVEGFWKNATVRRPGQRGAGKKAKKVLLSVRYSPEVVEYFKSTGDGWQSRMDEALKEWVASRRTA